MHWGLEFTPNFLHDLEKIGVVFLQFGAHEGIEVVGAKVGFRAFGKILFEIAQRIVPGEVSFDVPDGFVFAAGLGLAEGLADTFVVEAQKLIVIGVGEFVQDDSGLRGGKRSGNKAPGLRDVNHFCRSGVVAVVE